MKEHEKIEMLKTILLKVGKRGGTEEEGSIGHANVSARAGPSGPRRATRVERAVDRHRRVVAHRERVRTSAVREG